MFCKTLEAAVRVAELRCAVSEEEQLTSSIPDTDDSILSKLKQDRRDCPGTCQCRRHAASLGVNSSYSIRSHVHWLQSVAPRMFLDTRPQMLFRAQGQLGVGAAKSKGKVEGELGSGLTLRSTCKSQLLLPLWSHTAWCIRVTWLAASAHATPPKSPAL